MQRLKLPDGSYVNPAAVERIEAKRHFFGKNYYVQMLLDNRRAISVCTDLPEAEAQNVRLRYEQQLEVLAADVSAYKEGRVAGLHRGKEIGYANGRNDGYHEGFEAGLGTGQDQAWRAGVDAVLDQLKLRQIEFHDEMRYREHLVECRRQSLISLIDLIDHIVSAFTHSNSQQQTSQVLTVHRANFNLPHRF